LQLTALVPGPWIGKAPARIAILHPKSAAAPPFRGFGALPDKSNEPKARRSPRAAPRRHLAASLRADPGTVTAWPAVYCRKRARKSTNLVRRRYPTRNAHRQARIGQTTLVSRLLTDTIPAT
jgi:hypothetical protein